MERTTKRRMGSLLAVTMAIVGLVVAISGFTSFGRGTFEQAMSSALWVFLGSTLFVVGVALLYWINIGKIWGYVARETAPAIEAIARAGVKGARESGGILLRTGEGPEREVRVKCMNCGYLESEDAQFCSKCGKPI